MIIENEQFLSVKQFAEKLNVSTSLIYKYIRAGKFHKDLYIRFGRKILFRTSKIDKYLFPQEKPPEEEMRELTLQLLKHFNDQCQSMPEFL